MQARIKDALLTALIAGLLALPLAGVHTQESGSGVTVAWRLQLIAAATLLIFLGRLGWGLTGQGRLISLSISLVSLACALFYPSAFLRTAAGGVGLTLAARLVYAVVRKNHALSSMSAPVRMKPVLQPDFWRKILPLKYLIWLPVLACLFFPLTPLASRYALDVMIMVLTYVMLALGLNITVGYAGLLDLGYAGFYALGAYSYGLLAQNFAVDFWLCLPLAGMLAAAAAFLLGLPVLRLRGDYFAVVTLGFGEIVRLVLINWTDLTGGPNGISGIPRPALFGLAFTRSGPDGHPSFNEFFHLAYSPQQRIVFLYYLIFALALAVAWFTSRLRQLPLGRAWESFREDEIACASLGINRTWIKLTAYSLGAAIAGLAGAFFAARQGFISPESFTFTESATILAIVILGGVGHPLGIMLAAFFVAGLPELFRGFDQYRMIAFGLGMVLVMIWRPGGMIARRQPTIRLDG